MLRLKVLHFQNPFLIDSHFLYALKMIAIISKLLMFHTHRHTHTHTHTRTHTHVNTQILLSAHGTFFSIASALFQNFLPNQTRKRGSLCDSEKHTIDSI